MLSKAINTTYPVALADVLYRMNLEPTVYFNEKTGIHWYSMMVTLIKEAR
jgi:hypothetical protein